MYAYTPIWRDPRPIRPQLFCEYEISILVIPSTPHAEWNGCRLPLDPHNPTNPALKTLAASYRLGFFPPKKTTDFFSIESYPRGVKRTQPTYFTFTEALPPHAEHRASGFSLGQKHQLFIANPAPASSCRVILSVKEAGLARSKRPAAAAAAASAFLYLSHFFFQCCKRTRSF